jgi:hypothetical protein
MNLKHVIILLTIVAGIQLVDTVPAEHFGTFYTNHRVGFLRMFLAVS